MAKNNPFAYANDFVIRLTTDKQSSTDIITRIIYSLFIRPMKGNMPNVIFIGGKSGRGKSRTALKFAQHILNVQGIDLKDYMNDVNVYQPLEYPEKLKALLFDKRLKKVNVLILHEARELIAAKLWQSFLTQAISDVNALSRAVKRITFIIISQNIRDITTDMRYTIDYYGKMERHPFTPATLRLYRIYLDDSDIEKPTLKRRILRGLIIWPDGHRKKVYLDHFQVGKLDPAIANSFDAQDFASKKYILEKKMDRLLKEMRKDLNVQTDKVGAMIQFYSSNPDALQLIGKRRQMKWILRPEVRTMHDLTENEFQEFQARMNEALKNMYAGMMNPELTEKTQEVVPPQ